MTVASSKHPILTSLITPFNVAPKPVSNSTTPSAPCRVLCSLIVSTFSSKHMAAPICQASCLSHKVHTMCNGGDTKERSLSLFIDQNRNISLWTCFGGTCGWRGSTQAFAAIKPTNGDQNQITKKNKKIRQLDEQSLGLQSLNNELLAYFSSRGISQETLRRNGIMQRKAFNQIVIAFPYRRNGELVSCKYRNVNKRFWQERDTERIFYGLDDIMGARDIIIVEGEMDKLAMEEAGFRNCASVPDGAPSSVSSKDLPPEDQDKKCRYLWNCKEAFEKASRIILATDGDSPGQALAEELSRRLGRERCWRVQWPKMINGNCKDANEVLMYHGPNVLREVIENAYQIGC